MSIIHDIAHAMGVLEATEVVLISIADSQNQVACAAGCLHSMDGLFDGLVPLKNISEHKGKGVADSGFFAKGFIRVADSDLGNSHFVLVHS